MFKNIRSKHEYFSISTCCNHVYNYTNKTEVIKRTTPTLKGVVLYENK